MLRPNRWRWTLALALLLRGVAFAAEPQPGQAPPPIGLEALLQAPDKAKASWDAFQGKLVVLEFWATWCGPCVATIPHMNELVEKFKDRPVQFLSVTDEDEETVRGFLKDNPMKAWIGLDTDQSMMESYEVYAIPYLMLVDAKGKVIGIYHPAQITASTIEDALAGKPVQVSQGD